MRRPVLTPMMSRILARHASGATLEEIAEENYMSLRGIWTQSHDLKKRLGVRNLAQAVLLAHALGYISLPDDEGVVFSQSPFTGA